MYDCFPSSNTGLQASAALLLYLCLCHCETAVCISVLVAANSLGALGGYGDGGCAFWDGKGRGPGSMTQLSAKQCRLLRQIWYPSTLGFCPILGSVAWNMRITQIGLFRASKNNNQKKCLIIPPSPSTRMELWLPFACPSLILFPFP